MKLRSNKQVSFRIAKEESKAVEAAPSKKQQQVSQDKSKKAGNYEYDLLKDCTDTTNDVTYNFFAVVVDASYPHKAQNSDKFTCTLKLVDMGQPKRKDGSVETITMVVFANKFEDCPIVQRVGDIIRVHRANVSEY